jgi:hypothetical protein
VGNKPIRAGPLEAELYRLRGEAETAMQQAIDVARRQNAKSWE